MSSLIICPSLEDNCFHLFFSELSKAQKTFAKDLKEFNFECIDQQTDDEITIGKSAVLYF